MHQAKMIGEIDRSRLPRLLNGLSKSRLISRDLVSSTPGEVTASVRIPGNHMTIGSASI
jgi:hypothetical protein